MRKWISPLYPNGNSRSIQDLAGRKIYKIDKIPQGTILKSSGRSLKFKIFGFVLTILGLILI